MAFQHRENSGSLFTNDKKSSDKAPNARGTALIGGKMYRISAWTKQRENGEKWMSLSFELMEQEQPAQRPADPPREQHFEPDGCPF